MRRFLLTFLISMVLTVAVAGGYHFRTRPVPFDSALWQRDGLTTRDSIRYRMWPDVRSKIESGEIADRDDVLRLLGRSPWGDPDWPNVRYQTHHPGMLRFPYYILIQFQLDGAIHYYGLYPD